MKVELYHGRPWRSFEELAAALEAYGAWYNSVRLKCSAKWGGSSAG